MISSDKWIDFKTELYREGFPVQEPKDPDIEVDAIRDEELRND